MNLIERAVARLEAAPQRSSADLEQLDSARRSEPQAPAVKTDGERIAILPARSLPDNLPKPKGTLAFGPSIALPLARMVERGFLTPACRATAIGQEFRSIKGPILERAFGSDAQRVPLGHQIAVTSAMPGEGKTFCAINLAMSVAVTGDRSVLLIDADLARPSVAGEFGIESARGVIDFLKGEEQTPLSLIRATDVPGLSVLPAGQSQPHAGEFLASTGMTSLLEQLTAALPEWLIIIDTPPLLAVTETRSLVQRVGQVVVVVASGDTPRKNVTAGLATLDQSENVSLILNKVPKRAMRRDHYYGYY